MFDEWEPSLSKHEKLIVAAVLVSLFMVPLCLLLFWPSDAIERGSDAFQRKLFPVRYWSKQVTNLETTTRNAVAIYRSALLDLRKLQFSSRTYPEDELLSRMPIGIGEKEALYYATVDLEDDLAKTADSVRLFGDMVQETQRDLDRARQELAKAQGHARFVDDLNLEKRR